MYVCMIAYMCKYIYVHMDISLSLAGLQQPPGAHKSSQMELQIDSIWAQISALGTMNPPAGSRRSPGILKKLFVLQFVCPETCFLLCFPHDCFCTRREGISTGRVSTK